MKDSWSEYPIGEIFRLKQGTYLKKNEMVATASSDFPFPVYGANGIIGYSPKKMYDSRMTLVSCRGANCGVVHFTEPDCWVSNNSIALVPLKEVDRAFYYYVALSISFDDVVTGSAQPQITITNLSSKRFPLPDLPAQKKIAGILSAYDDLIENNLRRIKILEEMAQSLYREWFVHFRIPAKVLTKVGLSPEIKFVDSPLGKIPEGWEVKKLGELTTYLSRGLAPKYDEDGPSIVINQKCIRDERLTLDQARRQSKPIPSDKRVCRDDVLVNSTGVGTLGRVAQVEFDPSEHTVDTHVTILRPNTDLEPRYFGQAMFALQPHFDRLGAGATGQTELTRASISDIDVVVPPVKLQEKYGILIQPMRNKIICNLMRNETLRETRDLLLPKLLSS